MKIRNVIKCCKMWNNGYNVRTSKSGQFVTVLAALALQRHERWTGTLIQLCFLVGLNCNNCYRLMIIKYLLRRKFL